MHMRRIKNALLKDVLWYKIGGTTRFLLECSSKEDILEALEFVEKEKIEKHFVVGLGSNLLFTDEYYDGAVIRIVSKEKGNIIVKNDTIEAFAGEVLDAVIQVAFNNNLVGLEWAGGLPGTVGAAIRGNVGAFGGEVSHSFAGAEIAEVKKNKLNVYKANRRDVKFSYRASTVKKSKNLLVLSARFNLHRVDDSKLGYAKTTYFANTEYRINKHPLGYPSTGSAFKNITDPKHVEKVLAVFPDLENEIKIKWHGKVSMGYLIKRLDLAGFQVGRAQISNKHSNFIVNLGGARFNDVLSIIQKIQDTCETTFGFTPEPEVEIVQ